MLEIIVEFALVSDYAGYSGSFANGNTLFLNPNAPVANPPGLAAIGSQDFNGSNVTLALRYSF